MYYSRYCAKYIHIEDMNVGAAAVLVILSRTAPLGISWNNERFSPNYKQFTAPWYNGREIGFVLSTEHPTKHNVLNLVVVNNRRSDDIMVYRWESKFYGVNPPNLNDFSDAIYYNGRSFPGRDVYSVVDYIMETIKEFRIEQRTES